MRWLGRHIVEDVRGRFSVYCDDWRDGWKAGTRILAPSTYIFLASLLPALAFGLQLDHDTRGVLGVVEVLAATAMTGLLQAVVGGQPLLIVGVAEPIVIIYAFLYEFAERQAGLGRRLFLPWTAWVCCWTALLVAALAAVGACRAVGAFTRFSGELFGALIGVLFLQQAVKGLIINFRSDPNAPTATSATTTTTRGSISSSGFDADAHPWRLVNGLWSLVLASGLLLTSLVVVRARRWRFLRKPLRGLLADYGPPAMVLLWTGVSYAVSYENGGAAPPGVPRRVSARDVWEGRDGGGGGVEGGQGGAGWTVARSMSQVPPAYVAAALLPASVIAVLFFFDHSVSSLMAQQPEYHLTRPPAFSYDLLLLAAMTALCGLLGLPPVNGVLPQAPMHTRSLATLGARMRVRPGAVLQGGRPAAGSPEKQAAVMVGQGKGAEVDGARGGGEGGRGPGEEGEGRGDGLEGAPEGGSEAAGAGAQRGTEEGSEEGSVGRAGEGVGQSMVRELGSATEAAVGAAPEAVAVAAATVAAAAAARGAASPPPPPRMAPSVAEAPGDTATTTTATITATTTATTAAATATTITTAAATTDIALNVQPHLTLQLHHHHHQHQHVWGPSRGTPDATSVRAAGTRPNAADGVAMQERLLSEALRSGPSFRQPTAAAANTAANSDWQQDPQPQQSFMMGGCPGGPQWPPPSPPPGAGPVAPCRTPAAATSAVAGEGRVGEGPEDVWEEGRQSRDEAGVAAAAARTEAAEAGTVSEVVSGAGGTGVTLPLRVLEQRLSNLLQSLGVAVCLFATPAIRQIPQAVLWGYFAFMAIESFQGSQLIDRVLLVATDPARRGSLLRGAHPPYMETVPYTVCAAFTALQVALLAGLWALVTWAGVAGIAFPLPIMALVPLRRYVLPRVFRSEHLRELDTAEYEQAQPLPPTPLLAASAAAAGPLAVLAPPLAVADGGEGPERVAAAAAAVAAAAETAAAGAAVDRECEREIIEAEHVGVQPVHHVTRRELRQRVRRICGSGDGGGGGGGGGDSGAGWGFSSHHRGI